jgi:hypothetical protein
MKYQMKNKNFLFLGSPEAGKTQEFKWDINTAPSNFQSTLICDIKGNKPHIPYCSKWELMLLSDCFK